MLQCIRNISASISPGSGSSPSNSGKLNTLQIGRAIMLLSVPLRTSPLPSDCEGHPQQQLPSKWSPKSIQTVVASYWPYSCCAHWCPTVFTNSNTFVYSTHSPLQNESLQENAKQKHPSHNTTTVVYTAQEKDKPHFAGTPFTHPVTTASWIFIRCWVGTDTALCRLRPWHDHHGCVCSVWWGNSFWKWTAALACIMGPGVGDSMQIIIICPT